MERHHKEKRRDKLSKKEQDRQAIIKFIAGIVLMFALISYGAGIFALGLPFLVGISLLPKNGTLKDKWNRMGKKQRGIFILVAMILTPIIILGIVWLLLIASMLMIDIIVFLPIILILGWFIYRNPKRQTGVVTKILGSRYTLAIGVALLFVIIGLAGYNYYQYQQAQQWKNMNWSGYMTSLVAPDSHGYLHVIGNGYTKKVIKVNNQTTNLEFKVTDLITPYWLNNVKTSNMQKFVNSTGKYIHTDIMNQTDINKNTNLKDKTIILSRTFENYTFMGEGMPISNARIYLIGKPKGANTNIDLSKEPYILTDSNGMVVFKNVTEGEYLILVQADGYYVYTHYFAFNISIVNKYSYISIPLIPTYWHIQLHWVLKKTAPIKSATWNLPLKEALNDISNSTVNLTGTAIPTTNEINTAFNFQAMDVKIFWMNLHRQQSWYGWMGIGNPDSPIDQFRMQMLYNQQMLFTQSVYTNPASKDNIYIFITHDLWSGITTFLFGWIQNPFGNPVEAVMSATTPSPTSQSSPVYMKVDSVKITISSSPYRHTMNESGANVLIWSYDSISTSNSSGNSIIMILNASHLQTKQNKTYWGYDFDTFVWMKNVNTLTHPSIANMLSIGVKITVVYHMVYEDGSKVNNKEYQATVVGEIGIFAPNIYTH